MTNIPVINTLPQVIIYADVVTDLPGSSLSPVLGFLLIMSFAGLVITAFLYLILNAIRNWRRKKISNINTDQQNDHPEENSENNPEAQ